MKTLTWVIAFGAAALVALLGYGNARWNAGTTQLLNRLDAAQVKELQKLKHFGRSEKSVFDCSSLLFRCMSAAEDYFHKEWHVF